MTEQERAHRRVARRVWSSIGVVVLVVACTIIMGLSLHVVDARKTRSASNALILANNAAQLATLAESQYDICVSSATNAGELNAVLDYVKAAGALSADPGTGDFLNGLPYAIVPVCVAPSTSTTTTTDP